LAPQRGTALSAALGRWALAAAGWRIEGAFPDTPKCVVIVAPHTSNRDFFVGLAARSALRVRASFIAKTSLFWFPQGAILRWLDGIPVDRDAAHGVVQAIVEEFRRRDRLFLALAPEGTRRRVTQWKTGFYRIAEGAGVPIVPVIFDYGTRAIRIEEPFTPTGDLDGDVARLRGLFAGALACKPESFAP
jgi:1-acyl-sn-glycerol-3-phosphate acyltransferase